MPEKKTSDPAPNPTPAIDLDLTNAARRYLLALALLAENFPRSKGSYRLRSGCELLPVPSAGKKDAKETILMGAGAESEAAKALIALCGDRALLIKVAADAATKLGIVKLLPDFDSDIASLKADLTKGNKSAKAADNDIKKLRKAAKDATDKAATARKKATLAQEAATAARTKANGSNKDRDLTAATNKEETAKRLLLDAGEAEKVAKEAAAQLPDAAPADPQPELPKEPASTDESPAEGNSESGEQKI